MNQKLYDLVETSPVIAAVEDMEDLDACCQGDEIRVMFVLFRDICDISTIIEQIEASDKVAMVHIDLIIGLSNKEVTVGFIRNNTSADGIISAKLALIKRVRELFLYITLRVFVLDSMAFGNVERQMSVARSDIIEILPGLMPKVIRRVCRLAKMPVIVGGLISDKGDMMAVLSTGAISMSTANQKAWLMWNQKLKSALLGRENGFMYK